MTIYIDRSNRIGIDLQFHADLLVPKGIVQIYAELTSTIIGV